MTTNGGTRLVPRLRVRRTEVGVDDFTDAVDARISVRGASRPVGGVGLAAETALGSDGAGGAFVLRGSTNQERTFGGPGTRVLVSGEELLSESSRTRLSLSFGGAWRRGGFPVGAAVSAAGSGSGDFLMFRAARPHEVLGFRRTGPAKGFGESSGGPVCDEAGLRRFPNRHGLRRSHSLA